MEHPSNFFLLGFLLVSIFFTECASLPSEKPSTEIALWTQMTAHAEWSARVGQSSVVMPDGSIVLLGGYGSGCYNDTWRSMDDGATWMQMTAHAGWPARAEMNSVVMPDGSIVLLGGSDMYGFYNDTWRSTDDGATWTLMNMSSGWSARSQQSSVVMPDGSIILMGGKGKIMGHINTSLPVYSPCFNDTWRSTDDGATWTLMTAHAEWSARMGQSSVVMPDGSIVLMGGADRSGLLNDTWRSTDDGATWTQMTAHAEWSARDGQSSVVMPDGSIILMGGEYKPQGHKNDTWRSTDDGITWAEVNASAGWAARLGQSSVVMRDGSIILMGGFDNNGILKNDVWQLTSAGSKNALGRNGNDIQTVEMGNVPTELPLELKSEMENMAGNNLPVSRWGIDSINKTFLIYSYYKTNSTISVINGPELLSLDGKRVNNWTIKIVYDTAFVDHMNNISNEIHNNPEMKVSGIQWSIDGYQNPPVYEARVYVFDYTPENQKLNGTVIDGWKFSVYRAASYPPKQS